MQTQFICKSAGRFNLPLSLCLALLMALGPTTSWAGDYNYRPIERADIRHDSWPEISHKIDLQERADRINGISYVISGSLALIGGLFGQGLTADPLEKGVYTIFQTIGVASIGYGAYAWTLGGDDRFMFDSLEGARALSPSDRASVMRSYYTVKEERTRRQKFVRALTHGLIAALNFYGATQQKNESVKNALFFLGGVNTLACISFSF